MFFTTVRPDPSGSFRDADIWVMERTKTVGERHAASTRRSTRMAASSSRRRRANGTLYFTREPKTDRTPDLPSRLIDGRYAPAERLPCR